VYEFVVGEEEEEKKKEEREALIYMEWSLHSQQEY
jgi:hypothetical protein